MFYLKTMSFCYSLSGGLCSMALLQEKLFRSSYHLAVVGPLIQMTAIFVVVVVKTQDIGAVMAVSEMGVASFPDTCENVKGN